MLSTGTRFLKELEQLPPPERRIGCFELIERLGTGGFGQVWLAKEIYGETEIRSVALKLFPLSGADGTGDSSSSSRRTASGRGEGQSGSGSGSGSVPGRAGRDPVIEEARLLCQVEHPNIVRFHSLAVDRQKGIVGLAMEYVAGTSVEKLLQDHGKLDARRTVTIGIAVASALAAVHRAGLVHRDIKPDNVVESQGIYKLIDFGIAAAQPGRRAKPEQEREPQVIRMGDLPIALGGTKLSTLADTAVEAQGPDDEEGLGFFSGTLGFVDPVCMRRAGKATAKSDLYGLGALLYLCLTGVMPAAAKRDSLSGAVLYGTAKPPPVREVEPSVPEALAAVVDSLLEPERERRPRHAEQIARQLELLRSKHRGRKLALPPEDVGPFRGLGRYEQEDRDLHFGRDPEVASAIEQLRSRGLLTLVGPSGSGKSSLARAGILPAIADGALGGWPERWDSVVLSPGAKPRQAVGAALAEVLPGAAQLEPHALLAAVVERAHTQGRGLVLLIDQAEELATLASGRSRQWLLDLLQAAGEQPRPGLRVTVAVRLDLLDDVLALGGAGSALVSATQMVAPLSDRVWGQVVDQALGAYGYKLESDELRDRVLGEIKLSASAMPLVQFALAELWERRDCERKLLTTEGYEAMGGMAGALERHADAALDELAARSPGSLHVARRLLLELTTPQGTRAFKKQAELAKRVRAPLLPDVLEHLEQARLVVRDTAGLTLAHETLLSQWERLRGWLQEVRRDRELAGELEADAERWAKDEQRGGLWTKRRLSDALELQGRHDVQLSQTAERFVRAAQKAERAARRNRLLFLSAALVLVVVAVAVFVHQSLAHQTDLRKERDEAYEQRREALRLKDEAETARAEADRAKDRAKAEESRATEALKDMTTAKEKLRAANAKNEKIVMDVKEAAGDCAKLQKIAEQARVAEGNEKPPAPAPTPQPPPSGNPGLPPWEGD